MWNVCKQKFEEAQMFLIFCCWKTNNATNHIISYHTNFGEIGYVLKVWKLTDCHFSFNNPDSKATSITQGIIKIHSFGWKSLQFLQKMSPSKAWTLEHFYRSGKHAHKQISKDACKNLSVNRESHTALICFIASFLPGLGQKAWVT